MLDTDLGCMMHNAARHWLDFPRYGINGANTAELHAHQCADEIGFVILIGGKPAATGP